MYRATLIRENVQGYCKRHNMTLKELAKKADVPVEELSRLMDGNKVTDVETAVKIGRVMGYRLTELLEKGTK